MQNRMTLIAIHHLQQAFVALANPVAVFAKYVVDALASSQSNYPTAIESICEQCCAPFGVGKQRPTATLVQVTPPPFYQAFDNFLGLPASLNDKLLAFADRNAGDLAPKLHH